MAINLIESVQESMGIEALQKVDPNTQEPVPNGDLVGPTHTLLQATIPAVLAAMYEKTRTADTTEQLLGASGGAACLQILFGDNMGAAAEEIAAYSKTYTTKARLTMEQVAEVALRVILNECNSNNPQEVIDFVALQRKNILQYLPASLRMGQLLGDNTLDDATRKMDGPVSGLAYSVERLFSDSK